VQGGNQSTNISVIRPSRITGPVALPIRLDDQITDPSRFARGRDAFAFLTKKAISTFEFTGDARLYRAASGGMMG